MTSAKRSRIFLPNARAFYVWHSRHGFEGEACRLETQRHVEEHLSGSRDDEDKELEMRTINKRAGFLSRLFLGLLLMAATLSGCASLTEKPDPSWSQDHLWIYQQRNPGGPRRG